MKKVFSILFSLIMLMSAVHISLADHYCGGKLAATTISLDGKLATCGMEQDKQETPVNQTSITHHCCDNTRIFLGINGSYFPSDFSYHGFNPDNSQTPVLNSYNAAVADIIYVAAPEKSNPPGTGPHTDVELSKICILRI